MLNGARVAPGAEVPILPQLVGKSGTDSIMHFVHFCLLLARKSVSF